MKEENTPKVDEREFYYSNVQLFNYSNALAFILFSEIHEENEG